MDFQLEDPSSGEKRGSLLFLYRLAHAERLRPAVEGFVLAGSRLPDDDLLELAEQRSVVLLNRQVASLPSVVTDSADAGRQIIAHLAALGHRSVAYLGGPANAWSDGARWQALAASAQEAGIKVIRRGPFAPTLALRQPTASAGRGRHPAPQTGEALLGRTQDPRTLAASLFL